MIKIQIIHFRYVEKEYRRDGSNILYELFLPRNKRFLRVNEEYIYFNLKRVFH
jgi:hypothetical protein